MKALSRLSVILFLATLLISLSGLGLLWLNQAAPKPERWGFWGFQSLLAIPVGTTGLLITRGRPDNPIGWLILVSAILAALTGFSEEFAVYAVLTDPGLQSRGVLVAGLGHWFWVASYGLVAIFVPLLFPDGRLLSKPWRPIVWLGAVWILVSSGWLLFSPGPLDNLPFVTNPFGLERLQLFRQTSLPPSSVILGPGLLLMAVAAFSLVLRYRRSGQTVRRQLKWFAYASGFMPVVGILGQFNGWLPDTILFCLLASSPLSLAVAILRDGLYDIDILINRTLVYTALTAAVIAIYILVVGGLGVLFQSQGNAATALVATGVVAVLFQPMRERLQQGVNRLLYGQRDEPFEVLSRLGQRIEDTFSQEEMLSAIVRTVAQALKLPYVAVLNRGGETIADTGTPSGDTETIPLVYQGAPVGKLLVGRRSPGESFNDSEKSLLRSVAYQTGAAVRALQLTGDLKRARQQIVTGREEERRRLRRDLHDGLGPSLAAQLLKIGSASALLQSQPHETARLLSEMEVDLDNIIGEVRRIVYNLRPPALDQWGLSGALQVYADACENSANGSGSSALTIKVNAPEALPSLPAAVEVAAYHIGREGLTNVVRHAQASHSVLHLSILQHREPALCLSIEDDGQGITHGIIQESKIKGNGTGVGLASMRERAEELGGSCAVESSPGHGTRLTAVLPLGEGFDD